MKALSLAAVLKAALLASVVAALLAAAFHAIATEPVIEQAIALEELMAHPPEEAAADEPPLLVSRNMQRVGLWIGMLMYGLSWALLFSAVLYLAQDRLPGVTIAQRGMLLAGFAFWAIALLPFIKYPANPPGVGEPDTIGLRQNLYFGLIVAGLVGSGLALALQRALRRRLNDGQAWAGALGFMALYSLAFYAVLPANPDPVRIPADLLNAFRAVSVVGLGLFWAAFAFSLGWLLRRAAQSQAERAQMLNARPRGSQA